MAGHGNPETQFGAPGGPDPSEAGKKGGAAPRGVSPMHIMFERMDRAKATRFAQAAEDKILDGDFQHYKFLVDSHDGPVTQSTDLRVTGDRTVVLEPGDGIVVDPPEEGA